MTRLPDYVVRNRKLDDSALQEDTPSDIEAALAKARVGGKRGAAENSNQRTGEEDARI